MVPILSSRISYILNVAKPMLFFVPLEVTKICNKSKSKVGTSNSLNSSNIFYNNLCATTSYGVGTPQISRILNWALHKIIYYFIYIVVYAKIIKMCTH